MPFDLCYVIALSSKMPVIHCCVYPGITVLACFLSHHTSATSVTIYHTEDRHVHANTVPLDHYRSTAGTYKGHKPTYGGGCARHVHCIAYGPVGPVDKFRLYR